MHLHSVNKFKTNTCNSTYNDVSLNLMINFIPITTVVVVVPVGT